MATTAKTAEVYFENMLDTAETQDTLVDMVSTFEPDPADLQNSGNAIWRPVEQQSNVQDGWDLTGNEDGIIQEAYPAILGTPKNTFVKQRADDMRDIQFWENQGKRDGRAQATQLNKAIADAIKTQGAQYYRTDVVSGFDAIAEAQAMLNEEQRTKNMRYMILNDRDSLKYASDLAGRQTVQGRPDAVWNSGQIANNVAEFDVYTGSFLPNLAGGASPDTTVNGDQSFKPEGGSVNTSTGVVTNVDYRSATVAVVDSSSYNVGDKISFTGVKAIGYDDKTATTRDKTFTIVDVPDGTSITVYPKPIALDDSALTDLEKAYANIDTVITNGTTVARLNTDSSARTNLFMDEQAIEVMMGGIPAELMAEFSGKKVLTETLSNGLELYMVYDGDINDMSFRYRSFIWYGVTVKDPQRCGMFTTF